METSTPIVSGVLSLHREGELLRDSFRALVRSMRSLSRSEIPWEMLCVIDRGDESTRVVVNQEIEFLNDVKDNLRILEVDVGDLGLSRNEAVKAARGKFVGFLDGDDLCSEEWLLRAYRCCQDDPQVIAHPQVNLYFGRNTGIFVHPNQDEYDMRALFFHNLWTALSFAARDLYRALPYERNEVQHGLGYEDWNFNCRAIAAGYRHVAVPETVHCIRVKASQEGLAEQSAERLCVIKAVPLWGRLAAHSEVIKSPSEHCELARLLEDDPATIDTEALPLWVRREISNQVVQLNLGSSLPNISPPRANHVVRMLDSVALTRIGRGVRELHFVSCASSIVRASDEALVVADAGGGCDSGVFVLSEIAEHMHERVILFVASLAVQSRCEAIHIWDSVRAPPLVAKLSRLLLRSNVSVEWHQMVPGEVPPAGVLNSLGYLPDRWTMTSEVAVQPRRGLFGDDAVREYSKLRVLFLVDCPRARRPWSPQSTWYRVVGPGEALRAEGHDVSYGIVEEQDSWESAVRRGMCDVIVLHRGGYSRQFAELRRLTRERGIPLVYDADDNIISPDDLEGAAHLQTMTSDDLVAVKQWAESNVRCLQDCDAAFLATPALAMLARRHQDQSVIVSNFIPGFYRLSKRGPAAIGRDSHYFSIFYGPGSVEHAVYLEQIGEELRQALVRIPNARLIVAGGLALPTSLKLIANRIVTLPRVAPQFYMQSLGNVDLVLAPLTIDPFSSCKSWIKALEASVMGAQWIGSPLPDYRRFAELTNTGTIVESDSGWATAIVAASERARAGQVSELLDGFKAWMPDRVAEYAQSLRAIHQRMASKSAGLLASTTATEIPELPFSNCQLYWGKRAGEFLEERSLKRKVLKGAVVTCVFQVDTPGITALRLDPMDSPGRFEVLEIVCRSQESGRVLFRADERGGWAGVSIVGARNLGSGLSRLVLFADGEDPQILLPPIRNCSSGISVSVSVRISAEPAPVMAPGQAHGRLLSSVACIFGGKQPRSELDG
jgi:hypothetical protein